MNGTLTEWLRTVLNAITKHGLVINLTKRFSWTGYSENTMLISVTRTHKTIDGIFGNLSIDTSTFKCLTLERLVMAIPPGVYPMRWMWSEHFQQIMPQILVPNRIAIEIHWANYPTELEGCIATGTEFELTDDFIGSSKIAWVGFIKEILNQPNLTIRVSEDYGG